MLRFTYLFVLLFSLLGMCIVDKKHKLAVFYNLKRTAATVFLGVLGFIVWDVLGILLGIFFSGNSKYMSGLYLGPEFPVEEFLFLTFLCYFTLIIYRFGESKWHRT